MHHTDWIERRRFDSGEFARDDLARRQSSVSVCVPTLDEAGSIARTLAPLAELLGAGLIDQVVVVDSGSSDSTRAIVERAGIEFYDARELLPEAGRLLGKGDALWRAPGRRRRRRGLLRGRRLRGLRRALRDRPAAVRF